MSELSYAKDVLKMIEDLPPKQFKQVIFQVLSLANQPYPSDCKKLQGYEGLYRIDCGEFRVVYRPQAECVKILLIGKRNDNEIYKELKRKMG